MQSITNRQQKTRWLLHRSVDEAKARCSRPWSLHTKNSPSRDSEFCFFFCTLGFKIFAALQDYECRQASGQQSPPRAVTVSSWLRCRHQLFGQARQRVQPEQCAVTVIPIPTGSWKAHTHTPKFKRQFCKTEILSMNRSSVAKH